MRFDEKRNMIIKALNTANIFEISFHTDFMPKNYPSAIVMLNAETGERPNAKRYTEHKLSFDVYLIADIHKKEDPDRILYDLKTAFNEAYLALSGKDFAKVEFYKTRAEAKPVGIAKVEVTA